MNQYRLSLVLCTTLLWPFTSLAKVSVEAASELGRTLTPIGAVEAGNKEGTIPAWNGGMTKLGPMFDNYKPGDYYPDPFPEDKPLFKINAANLKQYATMLPEGAARRLELQPKLFYNVYTTRRTATYPDAVYQASKINATTAELKGDDNIVMTTRLGVPFPIPNNGSEAMVNHRLRYRADAVIQTGNTVVVNRNGAFQVNGYEIHAYFHFGNTTKPTDLSDNLIFQVVRKDTSPPRLAGSVTLVWDKLDGGREAWQYSPGTARVRQAPTVAFDNPAAGTDAIQNVDQSDMYNGSQRKYTWKLVGKKEMYIPYNNYRLLRPEHKLKDIIMPGHMNPDLMRYELHRVWIVEAELKPGEGNVYRKRRFYIDEDSWSVVGVDCFDGRNTLWKYQEGFVTSLVVNKSVVAAPQVTYDLFSGRYSINNLPNEMGFIAKFNVNFPQGFFTPQNLKNIGGR